MACATASTSLSCKRRLPLWKGLTVGAARRTRILSSGTIRGCQASRSSQLVTESKALEEEASLEALEEQAPARPEVTTSHATQTAAEFDVSG